MAYTFKPAKITKGSFAFCRITIASLIILAILFQNIWFLVAETILMLLSAIFKVERAPLILLWRYTVEKIKPGKPEIVDERGIFVSHLVAVCFSCLCISLVLINPIIGWITTGIFAILQISAACGFCSALKLYTCMNNGTCCRVGKKVKKTKDKLASREKKQRV
ncbi:DUF4395 family protein [Christensenellaceae bacterium OttesenSCG-928-L17]|nr:DUF4395 family protein [Christensenellaceae bacterium OttesenSCG-928-L17]